MQEYDLYGNIRKSLTNAEVQAPEFDTLFGNETLGGDAFRTVMASKLADHTVEAPGFDQLFAGETLGKPKQAPKIRMIPWWSIAGVAAACLAFFFLLPDKLGLPMENLSKAPETEQVLAPVKKTVKKLASIQPKQVTKFLAAPSQIKPLLVEHKNTSVDASMAENTASQENEFRDSTQNESLTKIKPSRSTRLEVNSSRSVEEAYAAARYRKTRIKPDKFNFGIGMNSANRLLSMVNSKSDGGFALQSVASSAADGYASLEGASISRLRATSSSTNEWISPENITAAMLENCETSYSLPINVGLTISIPIIHDLNLITGLQYSYMVNRISGNTFDLKQELHYLGIPVKLAVNLVKRGDFVVYTALGGAVEKGLSGVQHSTVENVGEWKGKQTIEGIQTSLTGQFGLSYNLNTNFLLYFEPGVAWYIPSEQPVSNRTEEPFNFNVSLGLRYRLQ